MTTAALPAAGGQRAEDERLPGILITIDGPGGVGKSTVAQLVATALNDRAVPVHSTVEPTHTPLGEHIRAGTETYRGMALACLVAGDRHHHLAAEILPALRAGKVVVYDRYLPSSLVLQRLDGLDPEVIWQLNTGAYVPDVAVLLNAEHPGSPSGCGHAARTAGSSGNLKAAGPSPTSTTKSLPNCAPSAGRRWPSIAQSDGLRPSP